MPYARIRISSSVGRGSTASLRVVVARRFAWLFGTFATDDPPCADRVDRATAVEATGRFRAWDAFWCPPALTIGNENGDAEPRRPAGTAPGVAMADRAHDPP